VTGLSTLLALPVYVFPFPYSFDIEHEKKLIPAKKVGMSF